MSNFKKVGFLLCTVLFSLGCEQRISYDVVILNGSVYSGSKESKIQKQDIGIIDDQIVTLGTIQLKSLKENHKLSLMIMLVEGIWTSTFYLWKNKTKS